MAITIQVKRGVLANRPALAAGEFYWATDTRQLFVGSTPSYIGQFTNASSADQSVSANSTALLTGSLIAVPPGGLNIGTVFRYRLFLSKTAAGTAANTFNFRLGTAGTTSDASICAFTLPVGTAVADTGQIDILVTIRGPITSSCVAQGGLVLNHNLATTGLSTQQNVVINTLSGTFNATTANLKASLSCSTAVSTVLTFQQVVTQVDNLV